jgi:hypothetical protein
MKRYGLTSEAVVGRWLIGAEGGTAADKVPGGRRVWSPGPKHEPNGGNVLYSYRTIVAVRNRDGSVALTPKRYSTTTSKLMGKVRRLLVARGYEMSRVERQSVHTAVPGQYGGFGPAWAPSSHETLPFVVWRKPPTCHLPHWIDPDTQRCEHVDHDEA